MPLQRTTCAFSSTRYQRDILKASERERHLERDKAQLRLDWKRKCEEVESTTFAKVRRPVASRDWWRSKVGVV